LRERVWPTAKSQQVCVPTAVNVAPQALVELRGTRNTGKRRGVRNIFGLAMWDKAKE